MTKILIIEDEKTIANLEKDYLEINQFTVEIENNGRTGLRAALSNAYDLIVLDLTLPELDGFEICRELRKHKDIPIIIVSAKENEIDKIRGLGLGADDYLVKPFSPSELVARVRSNIAMYQRLKQSIATTPKEFRMGELRVSPESRSVFNGDKEIKLTAKEFEVLLLLISHPNQVLTKEQIFERIWGFDSNADISTVTVHVKKLREKLEIASAQPGYIETKWGVGYLIRYLN
jgi:DNA-binding response OmpR family regulator